MDKVFFDDNKYFPVYSLDVGLWVSLGDRGDEFMNKCHKHMREIVVSLYKFVAEIYYLICLKQFSTFPFSSHVAATAFR